jgi:hypothetical protein
MANPDAKLKVAELDFNNIKDNLKNFLKSQSEFSDYNFEGSGMSVLLDLLAYNTHYMGYYLNMVSNEMFIDTAIKRSSVVSHAKLLGYVPRSRIASRAVIDLTITPVPNDSNSAITIPRFTRFVSESKEGTNYVFVNPSARVVSKNTSTGLFFVDNLEIKEGQPNAITFTYDQSTNPKQYFELPDVGIDTSTIQVTVQRSVENANQESYILAQDATDVDENAAVYYLEENKNGKYQIYFGDNVVGKSLVDGNIVIVSYVITSGFLANNLKEFKPVDTILNGATVNVTLQSESTSGAQEEDIENIRFTAPKAYISQNRAVTKNDYIALINRDYPYFEAVNVWGGEENVPPVFGKVFFTAKPLGGYEITVTETEFVKNNILKPFSVLTVTPEYVEADYNYLNITADVNYDPTKTNKSASEINIGVINAIKRFCNENLDTFNSSFKVSQLSRAIDDSDQSITSNDIGIVIEKRFAPDTTRTLSYTLDFGTELLQGTTTQKLISSPSFEYLDAEGVTRDCFIEEVLQSFTGIESIDVLTGGSGYTTTPQVIIDGDGTGASARALIVNGSVRRIEVIDQGTGYTSANITILGGGGSGASARINLQGRTGRLRIYYFDTNQIKKVITDDIGIINYQTGVVTLDNFSPISVDDPFGTMIIKVVPRRKIFSSVRNRIVTLDTTDPTSIITNINAVIDER